MKKLFLFYIFQQMLLATAAQPYVDIFQFRYTHSFRSQNNSSRGTPFTHLWAGSDIPVKLKDKTYLIFSPYYENWQIDSGSRENIFPPLNGLVLPVGLLLPLSRKWSWMITPMVRTHGEKLFANNTIQLGGASFFSYEKSPAKKLRFGTYLNSDFFGFFIMPLLGADWHMNDRNYFFGLLPGRFTWEHKFNNHFYGGVTFRAITSSYRLQNNKYLRIDDNQLSVFLDAFPAKRLCLTLEPGYGILRKLRTGTAKRKYDASGNWGDGFFIKLSAGYRMRL
jgi:hypothetical protein